MHVNHHPSCIGRIRETKTTYCRRTSMNPYLKHLFDQHVKNKARRQGLGDQQASSRSGHFSSMPEAETRRPAVRPAGLKPQSQEDTEYEGRYPQPQSSVGSRSHYSLVSSSPYGTRENGPQTRRPAVRTAGLTHQLMETLNAMDVTFSHIPPKSVSPTSCGAMRVMMGGCW